MASAAQHAIRATVKALAKAALAEPVSGAIALVLSALPVKELGEQLAEAFGEKLYEDSVELKKGSLPEAVIQAFRAGLKSVKATGGEGQGWDRWFTNWDKACGAVRRHRWKDLRDLALSIRAAQSQQNASFLVDSLELLDLAARLSGSEHANPEQMPDPLKKLLREQLGGAFMRSLAALLGKPDYQPALAELAVYGVALSTDTASPTPRPLTGPTDPRIAPSRGFFTGRQAQLTQVLEFLRGNGNFAVVTGRLYSIRGAPGIGKTELCKAALRAFLAERPACRAYYADVTGSTNVAGLHLAAATALGSPKLAEDPGLLLTQLHAQADLLYLDNLEDALPEGGGDTFEWLDRAAAGGTKVLASSRRKLGQIAREFPLDRLDPADAETLFLHFWTEAGDDPVTDPEGLREFLKSELDHHALTIRLLSAQADEARTWQRLAELWQHHRTRLAREEGRTDRSASLDTSLSISMERTRTQPAAVDLWLAMPCFPEGMCEAARAAVVPDGEARREAENLLVRLSLVERGGRLTMLAPLRDYALGQPEEALEPVWQRCLAYFLVLARAAEATEFGDGTGRAESVRALGAEFPNLAAALVEAAERRIGRELVLAAHGALWNSYLLFAVIAQGLLLRLGPAFTRWERKREAAGAWERLGDL